MDVPTSFAEWNSALVKALFLHPNRARTTLSRIDATGRIFEVLSDGKGKDAGKRSFIGAFGRTPGEIRDHFKSSPRIGALTKRDGIPPNFAALYLSLLAASADDDTFKEGKFRVRFAALVQMDELQDFQFQDLPVLWLEFARWTKNRSAALGDCAQLILPDPQHETRIGYSKRLAFPSYKDEKRLRSVLSESGLDSTDPFNEVSKAVYAQLGKFSQSFGDELTGFAKLVYLGSMQMAYDSPFWGAVKDITQEEDEKHLLENGHFCVQLDIGDPLYPEISVLSDDSAARVFGNGGAVRLPRGKGIYTSIWRGGASLTISINALLMLIKENQGLARSRPGAALNAGCLPFFHDSLGNLSSDGRYFENGPCCLLVRSGIGARIQNLSNRLDLKCDSMGSAAPGGWIVLSFRTINRVCLDKLASEVPGSARRFLAQGWTPAQPRISGGARYGQAVLLTPASNPFVRLEGATTGQYAITGESNIQLATGQLVNSDEGLYIPPASLIGLGGQVVCRYGLQMDGTGAIAILDVPVIEDVPPEPLRTLNDREAWLVDGRHGTLESLADSYRPPTTPRINGAAFPFIGNSSTLLKKSKIPSVEWARVGLNAIPPAFDWLAEALSLRYQRRMIMSSEDIKGHLRMAAEATGLPAWKLRRALFASGWLQSVERRLSPHGEIAASERTISYIRRDMGVRVRICGMFTRHERHTVEQYLGSGEEASRLAALAMPLSIGCIELNLLSEERAIRIATQLELRIVDPQGTAREVLGGLMQSMTKASLAAAPAQGASVSMWDESISRWVQESGSREQTQIGTILRSEGRQRHSYYINVGGGFRRTDSFAWALMVKAACSADGLGAVGDNADVDWAPQLIVLPRGLCRWWMHFGGGIIAVAADGRFAFRGGGGSYLWEDISISARCKQAENEEDRASARRTLALKLLKSRQVRRD